MATLPQTADIPRQYRIMLCGQDSAQCNHICSARRWELAPYDSADGFDDQALITGHNRAEFLKMTMLLLGRGPPTPEFARAVSKRRLKDCLARHGETTT